MSSHIWLNTRLYLINMALSDIIMCLTALPITPLYAFNGYWMFRETLCKLPAFQVRFDDLNNPFITLYFCRF